MPDYSYVDQPQVLQYLFYPRYDASENPPGSYDHFVEVGDNVRWPVVLLADPDYDAVLSRQR